MEIKDLQESISDKIQQITDGKVRVEHFSDEALESWIVSRTDWSDAVEVNSGDLGARADEYKCLHMYVEQMGPSDKEGDQYIHSVAKDLSDFIGKVWRDIIVVDWEVNTARQYVGTSLSDIIQYGEDSDSVLPHSKYMGINRYFKISMALRFKDLK